MATATLDENDVVRAFHAITRSALAHARVEGLLTDDELETAGTLRADCSGGEANSRLADVDVQVAGPALALFFAALSARGFPPEITSPDGSFALTTSNCPAPFANAFKLWQTSVPKIQSFSSDARHDLALVLCDKPAESSPLRVDVARTGADLKGIALEILQVRWPPSWQEGSQLTGPFRSAALSKTAFKPICRLRSTLHDHVEAASRKGHVPSTSPRQCTARASRRRRRSERTVTLLRAVTAILQMEMRVSPRSSSKGWRISRLSGRRCTRVSLGAGHLQTQPDLRLGAALADVLVKTPSIRQMLSSGPEWSAKAFFAATCLAIVEVALSRIDRHGVRAVDLGRTSTKVIGLKETPSMLS